MLRINISGVNPPLRQAAKRYAQSKLVVYISETMSKFPKLDSGQFAVLMADGATGHVLLESGKLSTGETDQVYKVFSDLELAKSYVTMMQKGNNKLEFVIKDHNQNLVEYIKAPRWI